MRRWPNFPNLYRWRNRLVLVHLLLGALAVPQHASAQSNQTSSHAHVDSYRPSASVRDAGKQKRAPRPNSIHRSGRNGVLKLEPLRGPQRVSGAYRVIETSPGTVARDVVIEGLTGDNLQRSGIRLRGQLTNITIRNSSFSFRQEPQRAPHLPACIEAGDRQGSRIEGLIIQNVTCSGFQMVMEPERYWNGDGLVAEANVFGLVIDKLVSRNSTDGCADIKPVFRATHMTLGGCKLLLRTWRGGEVDELRLETPIKRGGTGAIGGIWLKGSPADPPSLHLRRLIVRFDAPANIFVIQDGPAHIRVDACDIKAPSGTAWVAPHDQATQWTLGPSCQSWFRTASSQQK